MKILQEGKLPVERIYKLHCNRCSTIFEFQQKEAKYVSDQRDGDFLEITCPLADCNKKLTVTVKSNVNH